MLRWPGPNLLVCGAVVTSSIVTRRRIPCMDAATLSAISALGGAAIDGLTSGLTTMVNQRAQARAGRIAHGLVVQSLNVPSGGVIGPQMFLRLKADVVQQRFQRDEKVAKAEPHAEPQACPVRTTQHPGVALRQRMCISACKIDPL